MNDAHFLYDGGAGRAAEAAAGDNPVLEELGLGRSGRRCRFTAAGSGRSSSFSSGRLRSLRFDRGDDAPSSAERVLS